MQQNENKPSKNLGTTQIILIAGIALILIAIVAVGVLVWNKAAQPQIPESVPSSRVVAGAGNVVMDEGNVDDAIAELKRKAKEGTLDVKMNAGWTFPDGKSPSTDAYVANSESNHRPFYFDVALEDGTVIYTSPEIPVGSAIKDIILDTELKAGDYECVCTYHLLDDDGEEFSTASVVVRIGVLA